LNGIQYDHDPGGGCKNNYLYADKVDGFLLAEKPGKRYKGMKVKELKKGVKKKDRV
jgi:hypothetical protein